KSGGETRKHPWPSQSIARRWDGLTRSRSWDAISLTMLRGRDNHVRRKNRLRLGFPRGEQSERPPPVSREARLRRRDARGLERTRRRRRASREKGGGRSD